MGDNGGGKGACTWNNKTLIFGPFNGVNEEKDAELKASEVRLELEVNGKVLSEAVVAWEEVPKEQETSARPYPIVSLKTGEFAGVVHLKMWSQRGGGGEDETTDEMDDVRV